MIDVREHSDHAGAADPRRWRTRWRLWLRIDDSHGDSTRCCNGQGRLQRHYASRECSRVIRSMPERKWRQTVCLCSSTALRQPGSVHAKRIHATVLAPSTVAKQRCLAHPSQFEYACELAEAHVRLDGRHSATSHRWVLSPSFTRGRNTSESPISEQHTFTHTPGPNTRERRGDAHQTCVSVRRRSKHRRHSASLAILRAAVALVQCLRRTTLSTV